MSGALLLASFGFASAEDDTDISLSGPSDAAHDFGSPASAELTLLMVAPESAGSDYDRRRFKHWVDADGDGCDTRETVLIEESQIEAVLDPDRRCLVREGEWYSIYDDQTLTERRGIHIDHMVPLKEAWESGASTWTDAERQEYANDLDLASALIAVSAGSNTSKSDHDPAEWMPRNETIWCTYTEAWIAVKVKWSLSVDEAEHARLTTILEDC